jgi:hypothetical protein
VRIQVREVENLAAAGLAVAKAGTKLDDARQDDPIGRNLLLVQEDPLHQRHLGRHESSG